MKVVFDSTFLLLLVDEQAMPPAREGSDPSMARDRAAFLIETLSKQRATIIIPTPVLTEILVRSGSDVNALIEMIDSMSHVEIAPFGRRAAIECGLMMRSRWRSGKKKGLGQSWPKAKFDHQIVAIARTHDADVLYSDDAGVTRLAGEMNILGIWELPERPIDPQPKLPLPDPPAR